MDASIRLKEMQEEKDEEAEEDEEAENDEEFDDETEDDDEVWQAKYLVTCLYVRNAISTYPL